MVNVPMVMHECAWAWQGGWQQRRACGASSSRQSSGGTVVAHVQPCKDQCQQCVQSMGMRAQRRLCDGVTRAARRRRRGSARTAAPPRESGASGGPRHSSAPSRVDDERHLDPAGRNENVQLYPQSYFYRFLRERQLHYLAPQSPARMRMRRASAAVSASPLHVTMTFWCVVTYCRRAVALTSSPRRQSATQ